MSTRVVDLHVEMHGLTAWTLALPFTHPWPPTALPLPDGLPDQPAERHVGFEAILREPLLVLGIPSCRHPLESARDRRLANAQRLGNLPLRMTLSTTCSR
jgi:hypothetical protein